jgi:FtsX-like permease family
VIRLGLRLTLNGGREAAVRLAVTTAAVALGVGMLLVALAGMNAINAQNARTAWLNSGHLPGIVNAPGSPRGSHSTSSAKPLWWLLRTDYFGSQTIYQVDVAATGPGSPVPPGVPRLPGPGQFYASPAVSRLLRSTPASELGDRFPGHQIGTIGPAALPSPSSLIIVVGYSAQQLSKVPGAAQITSINTNANIGGTAGGFHTKQLETILAVGVLALLLPVLVFIATAARLAAARREQRFAAMRLVGATPRQVAVISAVEACVAALCGVAIGFGLFYGIRPALTDVAFTGQRFAPGDLSLGVVDIVVVAIGVPIAAAVSARFAMRRVQISPLGVTRRVTPPAPRAYRLAPLVAGIAELVYFVVAGHPKSTGGQIWAYLLGGFLVIAGLVVAGPWLTMAGARSVARRAQRPAALLAGRRLADNPSGAFRTISGLIIALFAASASVGVLTTILAYGGTTKGGTVASETLLEELGHVASIGVNGHRPPATATTKTAVPPALLGELTSIPGVRGATVVYSEPGAGQDSSAGLVLCSQLAHTPAIGTCPAGAEAGRLSGLNPFPYGQHPTLSGHVWPAAGITPQQLRDLSARAIVVQTNGSTAALEQARTDLEVAFPGQQQTPATFGEIDASSRRTIAEVQQIANVVIVASLVIAGCSLAVSVTAGISDRKRPFSLLRLAGAPLRVLRRMVVLEAAVPLLVISVFSAGLGFLAAGLFLSSQLGYSLRPPGVGYYLLVLGGIAASLAVIASTLPLIERIAGPEVARNE